MPATQVLSTGDARHAGDRLLEALRRSREADSAAASGPVVPGLRAVGTPANIEQAKGALMLRCGSTPTSPRGAGQLVTADSHPIAHTLLHGICEGNPHTEIRLRPLIRWLEDQLRHGDPDLARLPTAPVWSPTAA